jgi:hypothetical protein
VECVVLAEERLDKAIEEGIFGEAVFDAPRKPIGRCRSAPPRPVSHSA